MEGIYYKDGIYVLIDNESTVNCVINRNIGTKLIYGGRVQIRTSANSLYLSVDGLHIYKIDTNSRLETSHSYSLITSYLNAIETNGVDAFLENYKASIEFYYKELKDMNRNTESLLTTVQNEAKINSLLNDIEKIRNHMLSVLAILFNLTTYMSAGLENEKINNVCQSIMDSLA